MYTSAGSFLQNDTLPPRAARYSALDGALNQRRRAPAPAANPTAGLLRTCDPKPLSARRRRSSGGAAAARIAAASARTLTAGRSRAPTPCSAAVMQDMHQGSTAEGPSRECATQSARAAQKRTLTHGGRTEGWSRVSLTPAMGRNLASPKSTLATGKRGQCCSVFQKYSGSAIMLATPARGA